MKINSCTFLFDVYICRCVFHFYTYFHYIGNHNDLVYNIHDNFFKFRNIQTYAHTISSRIALCLIDGQNPYVNIKKIIDQYLHNII